LKIQLTRYGLALLLLLVAVMYPFAIYVIHVAMASLLGSEMAAVILISDLEKGAWVFFVASGIAIVGAFGLFLRKTWGRVISILAFGLFALLELTMAVFSPEPAQSWFSFSETRWWAATAAVLFSTALGWLSSPLAKKEFQTNRKLR
jgi:hypothetical protein